MHFPQLDDDARLLTKSVYPHNKKSQALPKNGKLYSCSGSVLAKHSIIDKYPYLLTLFFICVVYCLYLNELNIYDLLAFLILHKLLGHSHTSGPIATTWA